MAVSTFYQFPCSDGRSAVPIQVTKREDSLRHAILQSDVVSDFDTPARTLLSENIEICMAPLEKLEQGVTDQHSNGLRSHEAVIVCGLPLIRQSNLMRKRAP